MSNGVEFRQVTKRYGASGPLVVKGIDFRVPEGTLTTILGPSGCGKTTTLRMIAGLESPTAGRIFIAGRDVTTLGPAERNVSMVFQSYALFPHMNVIGNVSYGLTVSGVGKSEAARRARTTLESVGLVGYDERLPSELSGGQQQRVAVARALVLEPAVLLFDEPLSILDARLRRSMREEIRALQRRLKLTVAYVTHDQSEALAVSDQVIVMDAGVIAQAGTPQDLYERPATEFVAGSWARRCCSPARCSKAASCRSGRCVRARCMRLRLVR
jgi:iron(III) transport system ATP-binding protein